MIKNKKILLAAIFLFSFSCLIYVSQASVAENVEGWLWGGTDDGAGNNTGVGWVSMNNTTGGGTVSYGVNIPETDGSLSGYAWSENIGWISFNASDLSGCPDNKCTVKRSGDYLVGWARIVGIKTELASGNSGGWQGWIKLNSDGGAISYKVGIDSATNKLSGYAWSDELGWIDFSRAFDSTPICGTAHIENHIYAATDTNWGSYTACSAGIANPTLTSANFPAPGSLFGWSCDSASGGASINCSGYRASACVSSDCEMYTCIGQTCVDNCTGITLDGMRTCHDANWREVSPN